MPRILMRHPSLSLRIRTFLDARRCHPSLSETCRQVALQSRDCYRRPRDNFRTDARECADLTRAIFVRNYIIIIECFEYF